jgi:hypothetical protein
MLCPLLSPRQYHKVTAVRKNIARESRARNLEIIKSSIMNLMGRHY